MVPFTVIIFVSVVLWVGGLSYLMHKDSPESQDRGRAASDPWSASWTNSSLPGSMDGGE